MGVRLEEIIVVHDLKRQGLTVTAIAQRTGLDRKTVRKYLEQGLEPPAYGPRLLRAQRIDPFKDYPRERVTTCPELSSRRLRRDVQRHSELIPGIASHETLPEAAITPPRLLRAAEAGRRVAERWRADQHGGAGGGGGGDPGSTRGGGRAAKRAILEEFVALSGLDRKPAIRLLGTASSEKRPRGRPRPRYGRAVTEALALPWEASDRVCSKRLAPMIPVPLPALERHGRLAPDEGRRAGLLAISPATSAGSCRRRGSRRRRGAGGGPAPSSRRSCRPTSPRAGPSARRSRRGRFEGPAPAAALARLHAVARLDVSLFQPSFKPREKTRGGAKVAKRRHAPGNAGGQGAGDRAPRARRRRARRRSHGPRRSGGRARRHPKRPGRARSAGGPPRGRGAGSPDRHGDHRARAAPAGPRRRLPRRGLREHPTVRQQKGPPPRRGPVVASRMGASASRLSATIRKAMSRTAIRPASRSPSATGRPPEFPRLRGGPRLALSGSLDRQACGEQPAMIALRPATPSRAPEPSAPAPQGRRGEPGAFSGVALLV
jgi:hypothetical protein